MEGKESANNKYRTATGGTERIGSYNGERGQRKENTKDEKEKEQIFPSPSNIDSGDGDDALPLLRTQRLCAFPLL